MTDTYAEDGRLDREAEREEFEQWCDSLEELPEKPDYMKTLTTMLGSMLQDVVKEEEDGQSTSSG